ncbi:MAG TPA: class I SAM-dependent methyltransferase [Rhodopila sp.]
MTESTLAPEILEHKAATAESPPASGLAGALYQRLAARCSVLPTAFDLVLPDGTKGRLGNGPRMFSLVLRTKRALRAFASLDQGRIAQAFLEGDFDIEGDMLSALQLRGVLTDRHPMMTIQRFIQPLLLGQVRLNKRAISTHYDRDQSFYLQFLDPQVPLYTQGMFARDDEPMAEAALRKFAYCFDRCRLKPGDHILEIGPGWGAWLRYASQRGVKCTALSIAQTSIDYLEAMARAEGFDWQVIYADLLEYRTDRKYDAIVMMGVIEHLPQYDRVLAKFISLLKPGGRIFLDGASTASKRDLSSFIIKQIYPGNHSLLVLHDLLAAMALTRLQVEEIFDDRHSYYLTFRQWALNWERNRQSVIERFGEAEYRRFLLYLWGFANNMRSAASGCYRMILQLPADPSIGG